MTLPEHLDMRIVLICEYVVAHRSMVVLGTEAGDHYLPVRLAADEARAVEHALKGLSTPMPLAAEDPLLAVDPALQLEQQQGQQEEQEEQQEEESLEKDELVTPKK